MKVALTKILIRDMKFVIGPVSYICVLDLGFWTQPLFAKFRGDKK